MKPIIKEISCDECDLSTFKPDRNDCFHLSLRVKIGCETSSGADNFELVVCTAEWLRENVYLPIWGRHMLIVNEFDLGTINTFIEKYLAQCNGDEWNAIAMKIGRVLSWEFEDYQP